MPQELPLSELTELLLHLRKEVSQLKSEIKILNENKIPDIYFCYEDLRIIWKMQKIEGVKRRLKRANIKPVNTDQLPLVYKKDIAKYMRLNGATPEQIKDLLNHSQQ